MKKNKHATSIIEAIVAMTIISIWVTWMYNIYISSTRLEESISNKMNAVAIAREWIEAITNMRDTNWIILWSDVNNCWNTLNYNTLCIMNNTTDYDIPNDWHFKIYKNTNNRWTLSGSTTVSASGYLDSTYRDNFIVWIDSDWFYTQTWTVDNLIPLYTREIITKYIEDTNWDALIDSNDEKMEVKSLVQWMDGSSKQPHKIELKTILSNWKK